MHMSPLLGGDIGVGQNDFIYLKLLHRIIATPTPWMAPADTLHTHPDAFESMLLDRLFRVLRTSRRETAALREKW